MGRRTQTGCPAPCRIDNGPLATGSTMDHFITIRDTTVEDLRAIFDASFVLRRQREAQQRHEPILAGKSLAMIFELPSLRTRVSFEQAIVELGGHAIVLGDAEVGLGKRESPADVIRVLAGMIHGVIARAPDHQKLLDMASYGSVPVINAMSNDSHPAQALADAMTLMDEFGRDLSGRTVVFVGDGNNVARSLASICTKLDIRFVLASPPGFEIQSEFVRSLHRQATDVKFEMTNNATEAVRDADAVYTDTWVSMGQEREKKRRLDAFADFQVNARLLDAAPKHAIVLHCLPAYRGFEISEDVLQGPRSRVFPQAHNRLHTQKGLLSVLYSQPR